MERSDALQTERGIDTETIRSAKQDRAVGETLDCSNGALLVCLRDARSEGAQQACHAQNRTMIGDCYDVAAVGMR